MGRAYHGDELLLSQIETKRRIRKQQLELGDGEVTIAEGVSDCAGSFREWHLAVSSFENCSRRVAFFLSSTSLGNR